MDKVSEPSAEMLLSKRVQEMVLNGEEPPALYRGRVGKDSEHVSFKTSPIPVIDLSLLLPTSAGKERKESSEELEKLKSALSTWGCFQAVRHGIPIELLDRIRGVAREFFGQPKEEKQRYAKKVSEFQGYGSDPPPEDGQFLDWSDRIFLDVFPEDQRDYTFWPQNPPSFGAVMVEYCSKMKALSEVASRAMARSLNLEETYFQKQFGEREQLQARFNYYLPCQRPDLILGLKPHADGSGYTIILQDEEGLQIFNDDKWCTVPKNPEALLILLGDQMEIMSNGAFKSPVHRVLSNSEKDRISVAVFYTPEKGKEIGPEEGLVDQDNTKVYKKVKDYADIHWEYYQRGMRALHVARP